MTLYVIQVKLSVMAQNQHKSQRDQDALMSVHQQTIWKQRVKKELDHLVLNTTFHINPYKLRKSYHFEILDCQVNQ